MGFMQTYTVKSSGNEREGGFDSRPPVGFAYAALAGAGCAFCIALR